LESPTSRNFFVPAIFFRLFIAPMTWEISAAPPL